MQSTSVLPKEGENSFLSKKEIRRNLFSKLSLGQFGLSQNEVIHINKLSLNFYFNK